MDRIIERLEELKSKDELLFEYFAEKDNKEHTRLRDLANRTYDDCIKIVKEESKNSGWIPVSERLPYELGFNDEIEFNVTTSDGEVTSLCFSNEYEPCFYDRTTNDVFDDVVAWQPLPQRYEVIQNDND